VTGTAGAADAAGAPDAAGAGCQHAAEAAVAEVGHGFFRDPYPLLGRLREDAPVHIVDFAYGRDTSVDTRRYVITRYADAVAALTDPRLSSEAERAVAGLTADGGDVTVTQRALIRSSQLLAGSAATVDPPDHTRLRRMLVRAFSAKRVERLRPGIQAITDELYDRQAGRDEIDLVADVAKPLSLRVVCELLGLDHETVEQFRLATGEGSVTGMFAPADEGFAAELIRAIDGLEAYIAQVIEEKRARPAGDLLSDVIAVREDGRGLSEVELRKMTALLILAAYETTVHLIGNGTLALLRHPQQAERLRADPGLLPGAIVGMMRYDGPALGLTRYALEDLEVSGVAIPRGSYVFIAMAAANRDPRQWACPERFDVTRRFADPHLGFGYGPHYCLGARLASAEAESAIGTLLRRYPRARLAAADPGALPRQASFVRGVSEITLHLT
jgi:cytochrome P450